MRKKRKPTKYIAGLSVIAIAVAGYYGLHTEETDHFTFPDDPIYQHDNTLVDSHSTDHSETTDEQTLADTIKDEKKETSLPRTEPVENQQDQPQLEQKPQQNTDPFTKVRYKLYNQGRWNYSVKYPAFLTKESYSENNDGGTFEDDRGISLTTYGSWNIFNETITDIYNKDMSTIRSVTYKRLFKDKRCYVKSGYLKDNRIFYLKKAIIGAPDSEIIVTLLLCYPKQYNQSVDKVIRSIFTDFPIVTNNQ